MIDYDAVKRELANVYRERATGIRVEAERKAQVLDAIAHEITEADSDYAMYLHCYGQIVGKEYDEGLRLPMTPTEWVRFLEELGEFGDLLAGRNREN